MIEKKSERFDAVIFDWGGVISPGGTPDEVVTSLSSKLSVDVDTAQDLIRKYSGDLKRGKINDAQFWELLSAETGRSIPSDHKDIWTPVEYFKPDEALQEYIKKISKVGLLVGILSNTFPATADAIRSMGWYEGYASVVTSSDVGFAKPDPEIYQLSIDQLGVSPERAIFVDDQMYCLEAAKKFGITTVLAMSTEQVISELTVLTGIK